MAEKYTIPGRTPGVSPATADSHRQSLRARDPAKPRRVHDARRSLRRRFPLQAVINYGLSYSEAWPVRDLSMAGIFVDMAASELYEGRLVEVVLRYPYKGRPVEHRIPARVQRVSPEGVALRFGQYDDDTYTDLVNLLYAQ